MPFSGLWFLAHGLAQSVCTVVTLIFGSHFSPPSWMFSMIMSQEGLGRAQTCYHGYHMAYKTAGQTVDWWQWRWGWQEGEERGEGASPRLFYFFNWQLPLNVFSWTKMCYVLSCQHLLQVVSQSVELKILWTVVIKCFYWSRVVSKRCRAIFCKDPSAEELHWIY